MLFHTGNAIHQFSHMGYWDRNTVIHQPTQSIIQEFHYRFILLNKILLASQVSSLQENTFLMDKLKHLNIRSRSSQKCWCISCELCCLYAVQLKDNECSMWVRVCCSDVMIRKAFLHISSYDTQHAVCI